MVEVLKQVKPKEIDFPVQICVSFIHTDKRRRDCDNALSSILDLMVDCKIIKDDNWQIVRKLEVTNTFADGLPFCLVKVLRGQ